MCVSMTPVLFFITTVIIEMNLHCFTESVSLRVIGKPTSRAEIGSSSFLYLKAVKGAHNGSALIVQSRGDFQCKLSNLVCRRRNLLYASNSLKFLQFSSSAMWLHSFIVKGGKLGQIKTRK